MLPARHYRNALCFAELALMALLFASSAHAQTAGTVTPATPATATTPRQASPGPSSTDATLPSTAPSVAPTQQAVDQTGNAPLAPTAPTAALGGGSGLLSTEASELDVSAGRFRDEVARKPPESARWLLIGTGLGATAAWYGGAWGIRELWPSQADRNDLKIPVAGPFIDLSHTGCPASNPDCSTFQLVVRTILVSLDAIGQAGGIALMLQGAVLSTASVEAPRSTPTAARSHTNVAATVVPVPWFDGDKGGGLGLAGRF